MLRLQDQFLQRVGIVFNNLEQLMMEVAGRPAQATGNYVSVYADNGTIGVIASRLDHALVRDVPALEELVDDMKRVMSMEALAEDPRLNAAQRANRAQAGPF